MKFETYMALAHKASITPMNPYACRKNSQSTSRSVFTFLGFLSRSSCSGPSKQNNIGSLFRNIRTGAHCHTTILSLERRTIVYSITGHCDNIATIPEFVNNAKFLFRSRTSKNDLFILTQSFHLRRAERQKLLTSNDNTLQLSNIDFLLIGFEIGDAINSRGISDDTSLTSNRKRSCRIIAWSKQ